jgi:uncharacterized membrane protein
MTAGESKHLAEYEAVCRMAWDGSFVGSKGVARGIYNALTGIAGSKMLKQAEKDMVTPSAPPSHDASAAGPSGGTSSGVGADHHVVAGWADWPTGSRTAMGVPRRATIDVTAPRASLINFHFIQIL